MGERLYTALLFSGLLGNPAAAQTSSIAGTGLTNAYGGVTLAGTTTPSNSATESSTSPAGVSPCVGSGVGVVSARSTPSAAPSSGSAGSPSVGTATSPSSTSVPDCQPPGVSGIAPFLAGTNLSYAP
jgi:hypothetical protein